MSKIKFALLLLISALCGAALFGCNKTPEILDAPQNLRIENNVLYWDEVEHASGYAFYIKLLDKEVEIKNNCFDFSDVKVYGVPIEVEVLAIGDGASYLNSDWVKYSCVLTEPFDPTYGLTYTLTDDGTGYVVSANDDTKLKTEIYIPDYYNNLPVKEIRGLARFKSIATDVRIPATVEKINARAFANFSLLTNIKLPESVTYIGEEAFSGCTALSSISFPSSLETIEKHAFIGCSKLTAAKFTSASLSIGSEAFAECSALKKVHFPENASLGFQSFIRCTALTDVTFAKDVSIGGSAFFSCSSLTAIDCSLCSKIEKIAFADCNAITDIKFPEDPNVYSPSAFQLTGWYKNQPNGYVIVNGDTLFRFKGDVPNGGVIDEFPSQIKKIAEKAFSDEPSSIFNGSNVVSIEIPDDVRLCGTQIFRYCESLKHVKLPNGLTEIPDYTFAACDAIESIEIPEGVTKIGKNAFSNCKALKSVRFPSTLTEINSTAFIRCDSLTKLYLPAGVTTLSPYTFNDVNYEEIILPVSLNMLLANRFTDETIIYYRGTKEQWEEYFAEVEYKGTRYYYSETPPDDNGNYWHFAPDGKTPVIWTNK